MDIISRDQLKAELAEVSHKSWMRQAKAAGRDPDEHGADATDHDLERAEDIILRLEQLGLYPPAAS